MAAFTQHVRAVPDDQLLSVDESCNRITAEASTYPAPTREYVAHLLAQLRAAAGRPGGTLEVMYLTATPGRRQAPKVPVSLRLASGTQSAVLGADNMPLLWVENGAQGARRPPAGYSILSSQHVKARALLHQVATREAVHFTFEDAAATRAVEQQYRTERGGIDEALTGVMKWHQFRFYGSKSSGIICLPALLTAIAFGAWAAHPHRNARELPYDSSWPFGQLTLKGSGEGAAREGGLAMVQRAREAGRAHEDVFGKEYDHVPLFGMRQRRAKGGLAQRQETALRALATCRSCQHGLICTVNSSTTSVRHPTGPTIVCERGGQRAVVATKDDERDQLPWMDRVLLLGSQSALGSANEEVEVARINKTLHPGDVWAYATRPKRTGSERPVQDLQGGRFYREPSLVQQREVKHSILEGVQVAVAQRVGALDTQAQLAWVLQQDSMRGQAFEYLAADRMLEEELEGHGAPGDESEVGSDQEEAPLDERLAAAEAARPSSEPGTPTTIFSSPLGIAPRGAAAAAAGAIVATAARRTSTVQTVRDARALAASPTAQLPQQRQALDLEQFQQRRAPVEQAMHQPPVQQPGQLLLPEEPSWQAAQQSTQQLQQAHQVSQDFQQFWQERPRPQQAVHHLPRQQQQQQALPAPPLRMPEPHALMQAQQRQQTRQPLQQQQAPVFGQAWQLHGPQEQYVYQPQEQQQAGQLLLPEQHAQPAQQPREPHARRRALWPPPAQAPLPQQQQQQLQPQQQRAPLQQQQQQQIPPAPAGYSPLGDKAAGNLGRISQAARAAAEAEAAAQRRMAAQHAQLSSETRARWSGPRPSVARLGTLAGPVARAGGAVGSGQQWPQFQAQGAYGMQAAAAAPSLLQSPETTSKGPRSKQPKQR